MMLTKLERFTEMVELRDNFDSFLDKLWGKEIAPWARHIWKPPVYVHEDDFNITAKMHVPGIKKNTLKILLSGNALLVSGKTWNGEGTREKVSRSGDGHSDTFTRSFLMPFPVDGNNIKATFKDGFLQIVLHKAKKARLQKTCVALCRER